MSKASAHQQLQVERNKASHTAARLENLATALREEGEMDAARKVEKAVVRQYDVYEELMEALHENVFPPP